MPKVTQEEFNKITCNQCGDCCEAYYFDSDEFIQNEIEAIESVFAWDSYGRNRDREWEGDALVDEWGFSNDDLIEWSRRLDWYKARIPLNEVFTNSDGNKRYKYSCSYFKRLTPDFGICTIWNHRPLVCKYFPYGTPKPEFARCSWAVEIVDE